MCLTKWKKCGINARVLFLSSLEIFSGINIKSISQPPKFQERNNIYTNTKLANNKICFRKQLYKNKLKFFRGNA